MNCRGEFVKWRGEVVACDITEVRSKDVGDHQGGFRTIGWAVV